MIFTQSVSPFEVFNADLDMFAPEDVVIKKCNRLESKCELLWVLILDAKFVKMNTSGVVNSVAVTMLFRYLKHIVLKIAVCELSSNNKRIEGEEVLFTSKLQIL